MTTKFTLYGGKEMADNLNAMSKATRKKYLYAMLKEAAEPMRHRAGSIVRRLAPAPDIADNMVISASQTGDKGSRLGEFAAAVAVGPAKGFRHGLFLEYGTVRARAFPFLRVAFDATAGRSVTILQERIWALLRKANKTPSKSRVGSGGTL